MNRCTEASGWVRSDHLVEDRIWAAILLCLTADTCSTVLAGQPVRCGGLDAFYFKRALRGGPLPAPDTYITITNAHLDAIVEAGPIAWKRGGQW